MFVFSLYLDKRLQNITNSLARINCFATNLLSYKNKSFRNLYEDIF